MRRREVIGAATATLSGLAGCLGDTEYTVASVSVPEGTGPVALDVTVADAAATVDGPALLEFVLRNASDRSVDVRNRGVWPLGLLGLTTSDDAESAETLLVSDRYAESDRVEVTAKTTGLTNDEPLVRPLGAGESVTERYAVHGDRIRAPGTYTLRGYFEAPLLAYRVRDDDGWTAYRPEIGVTVAERSVLP